MVLEVFSNLNDFMILCCEIQSVPVINIKSGDLQGIYQKSTFIMQSCVMDSISLMSDEAEED